MAKAFAIQTGKNRTSAAMIRVVVLASQPAIPAVTKAK
jgi:hypothetical protein